MLKQRTPSSSQLPKVGSSKKIDDEPTITLDKLKFRPMTRQGSISALSGYRPIIINASLVITCFAQSLIPLVVYKSSIHNDDAVIITNSGASITRSNSKSTTDVLQLQYQGSSAVMMAEIVKLITAIFVVFHEFEFNIPQTMETMMFDVFQVHTFALSGVLYAISTVLTLKMIASIGILYLYYSFLFRLILTTTFWKLIFHQKQLTQNQLVALTLVLVSTVFLTFEYGDSWSFSPFLGTEAEVIGVNDVEYNKMNEYQELNEYDDHNPLRRLLSAERQSSMFVDYWWGFLVIEALSASIGRVIAEQKYKTFEKDLSYFAQSSSMYLWGFAISGVMFYIANLKEASKQLLFLNLTYSLNGFNAWTWALVLVLVVLGFSSNFVLKYFNNMVLSLVMAVALCFAHILVYWISNDNEFISQIGLLSVVSCASVGAAVYLYLK